MSIVLLYFSAAVLVTAANTPHSFTILDFWQGKCEKGEQAACDRLQEHKKNELKLEQLNRLAREFGDNIKPEEFLLNDRPNLGKAYPMVIRGYLESFDDAELAPADRFAVEYCARHFHNYWLNKRLWWPTDAEDSPDWRTIYVYIVDHYHGICLNRPF